MNFSSVSGVLSWDESISFVITRETGEDNTWMTDNEIYD